MKYLFLLFPLFLMACSSDPKTDTDGANQRVIDSLTTLIEGNNDSIQVMLDRLPCVSPMISPSSVLVHPGESFEAKVSLAGHLWLKDKKIVYTVNNTELPVSNNMATYRMKATEEGLITYNVVAKIPGYNGAITEYPVTGTYYVTSSATALPNYSEAQLDSIYNTTVKIPRGTFPGTGPAYQPWLKSTLNFNKQNVQDVESLNRILSTQDSIIRDLKEIHLNLKFDYLDVVISPLSSVVKPGDEYIAFIYVAGTSSLQQIEIQSGSTTTTDSRVVNVKSKPDGRGIQEYRGMLFYELFDKRDSIEFSTQYFVDGK